MSNIFEQASRLKLRFDVQGSVSTEQLWDVKLDVLIAYEEAMTDRVESYGKSVRRKAGGRKTKAQEMDELGLAIVTSILDIRLKEKEDEKAQAEAKIHNQKIMDLIARKQDAELEALSAEELQKLLK